MLLIGEYIKYKLNSKGKYDIHSPFVFDFVTKCLTNKLLSEDEKIISKFKVELAKDTRKIKIQDFGAGSKKLGNIRSVQQIFKNAASKGVYAKLLYQLNLYYDCKKVLEFGTSLGVGTVHLALGNKNAQITTVDACLETQQIAKENISKFGIRNIDFIHSDFESYIDGLENEKFDLIFIDGHHDGTAMLKYLNKLQSFSHENTIFVLDDIRWSDGMFEAWNELVKSENDHLTLDLFRMGIVMKRPQQAKEHFVIKLKGVLGGMI